jgi:hypothetical protein
VVLVEDVHPMLGQPLLNDDRRVGGVMPPAILNSALGIALVVLQPLIEIQERAYVLLRPHIRCICRVVVVEIRCHPGKGIVVHDSFSQEKNRGISPPAPCITTWTGPRPCRWPLRSGYAGRLRPGSCADPSRRLSPEEPVGTDAGRRFPNTPNPERTECGPG